MDAYTPYPVEGLAAELGVRRTRIPFVVLSAGWSARRVGFFMQYYSMAIDYPVERRRAAATTVGRSSFPSRLRS